METYYFNQINLPFFLKAKIIVALMRFIVHSGNPVARSTEFNNTFIKNSPEPSELKTLATGDQWLAEHVARLFWVCCELGLMQYQYPYPHRGQTYLPTRAGRIVAHAPTAVGVAFVGVAYFLALCARPIKYFSRIRNVVAIVTGGLLWWRRQELSSDIVAISVAAGIVSTWIASFFAGMKD